MWRTILSMIILYQSLHYSLQHTIADVKTSESGNNFDVITLSQEWPVTVCKFWKYILYPGGECILPKQENRWTIHGIWPREIGGKYLEFCNDTWALDPEQIKPIEDGLSQAETSVYKETHPHGFWAWEWRRHGTCAAAFEPFNTQLKYFSKSIEWNEKYPVTEMLEAANIFPSDTTYLDPMEVANAVKARTKKDPMIGCYVIDDVPYLQEVRICLDKEFNVMDCKLQVVDSYCNSPKGFIYAASP